MFYCCFGFCPLLVPICCCALTRTMLAIPISLVPWEFHPEFLYKGRSWVLIAMYIIFGIFGGSVVGFTLAMRTSKKFNRTIRESVFFQQSGLANNATIRKSLALPSLEELMKLQTEHAHAEHDDAGREADEREMFLAFKKESLKYTSESTNDVEDS
jgi:hypothetical protein